MKTLLYYLLLLIFIALIAGYLIFGRVDAMGMTQMLGVSAALALYTVAMTFVGEGTNLDERDILHRNLSNRSALIAGRVVFSAGLIYQIFITGNLDWWLLLGLITINLTKIISLIYMNYRK
jgi:hypothetical protein